MVIDNDCIELPYAHDHDGVPKINIIIVGVIHLMDNDKNHNAFGGLLFGYDTTKMRFWVPSEWPVANQGNNGYLKMYIRVSMDA